MRAANARSLSLLLELQLPLQQHDLPLTLNQLLLQNNLCGLGHCHVGLQLGNVLPGGVRSAPRARDALRQRTCSASFSRLMNSASSEKLSSSSVWLRLLFFASMSFSLDMSVLVAQCEPPAMVAKGLHASAADRRIPHLPDAALKLLGLALLHLHLPEQAGALLAEDTVLRSTCQTSGKTIQKTRYNDRQGAT